MGKYSPEKEAVVIKNYIVIGIAVVSLHLLRYSLIP